MPGAFSHATILASSRDHGPGPERQLRKILDQHVGLHLPFVGQV
jgi:hypothetical protein